MDARVLNRRTLNAPFRAAGKLMTLVLLVTPFAPPRIACIIPERDRALGDD